MSKSVTRRGFLTAAGGVAALPLLSSLGPFGRYARAQQTGSGFPKRLVFFFSANGTIPSQWKPKGDETSFEFGDILAPLTPFKSKVSVIAGLRNEAAYHGPGDGHQTGMGTLLTNTSLLPGDLFEGGGDSGYVGWGGGISVDQHVANHVGKDTKLKSLEAGVQVKGATVWSRMSYLGSNQPIPPENDPAALYQRVFADLGADPLGLARLRARRKSVLDLVMGEYEALSPKLATFDREKLDQHLTAVREVEQRLDAVADLGGACAQPELGAIPAHMQPENFEAIGRLQMDQVAMSLACDLTRVASVQFSQSVSNHVFSDLGISEGHHDLSHEGDENADAKAKLITINTWYAQQFAYLLERLDSIPEGEGTLLDHTLVVWVNELGKGNSHSRDQLPFVLAGSCGGYIQTGRWIEFFLPVNHSKLLVTIMNAMGVEGDTFGNPEYGSGPLTKLLV